MIARLRRLWRQLTGAEPDPKEVFDAALAEFKERYRKSRDLVAAVLKERDATRAALEAKQADLISIRARARAAVQAGDDSTALNCIEREKALENQVADMRARLKGLEGDAARAREMLLKLDAEVVRLEHDKKQASYLSESSGAHAAMRQMLRDLDDTTASPALGKARDSLEISSLKERFAQELDEQDRLAEAGEQSADERLRELKKTVR